MIAKRALVPLVLFSALIPTPGLSDYWRFPTGSGFYKFSSGCTAAYFSTAALAGVFGQSQVSWSCAGVRPGNVEGTYRRTNIVYNETTYHGGGSAYLVCEAGSLDSPGCPKKVENNNDSCPASTTRGNPVGAGTGLKIEKVIVFESAGPNPLILERTYVNNGQPRLEISRNSEAGAAWRMSFDGAYARVGTNEYYIALPNGREFYFKKLGSGQPYELYSVQNSAFVKTKGDAVDWTTVGSDEIFTLNDGTKYIFSTA